MSDDVEGAWPEYPAEPPGPVVAVTAAPSAPPIMRRDQWGALPPKSNPGGFSSLDAVVLHYTAAGKGYVTTDPANHDRCIDQVQAIQRQHQAIAEQSDIEYNLLVCGCTGTVFEGRVVGIRGGANGSAETNKTMPSICALLGVDDRPTPAMLASIAWCHARIEDLAGTVLTMFGHRDVYATSCPGDPLYDWILADGYHPHPPEDDDMTFLLPVTNHPGYPPPLEVFYVANGIERRWVRNETQLAVLTDLGLPILDAVDFPNVDMDGYGLLIGPAP